MGHTLVFADDATLTENGNQEGIPKSSKRVTDIVTGSRADADMEISIKKTKVMHVRAQDEVTATTTAETVKACRYVCPHLHCGFQFYTRRGMPVHAGRCEWRNEIKIVSIVDCKGEIHRRKYKVRLKGFTADHDTWEPKPTSIPRQSGISK